MANWSVDPPSQCPRDDRRNSSSTLPRQVDTAPIPLSAIQRHHRQNSNTSARQPLSQDELRYLAYVVEALATLVIASALSDEGVQYRNTFAWKFVVIPCPPPSPPSVAFLRVWLTPFCSLTRFPNSIPRLERCTTPTAPKNTKSCNISGTLTLVLLCWRD